MDPRHPVSHTVIEGEGLERERIAANRPFPFTPRESLLIVIVTLAAIGAALYAANAAVGVPV